MKAWQVELGISMSDTTYLLVERLIKKVKKYIQTRLTWRNKLATSFSATCKGFFHRSVASVKISFRLHIYNWTWLENTRLLKPSCKAQVVMCTCMAKSDHILLWSFEHDIPQLVLVWHSFVRRWQLPNNISLKILNCLSQVSPQTVWTKQILTTNSYSRLKDLQYQSKIVQIIIASQFCRCLREGG